MFTGWGPFKQAAAPAVLEAKTQVRVEFREASENDYRLFQNKFWQTIRCLLGGGWGGECWWGPSDLKWGIMSDDGRNFS